MAATRALPLAITRLTAAVGCLVVMSTSAHAADTWSDPFPGVRRLHRTTASQNVNAMVVDLCAPGIRVRATADGERGRTASSFGALVGAQLVINGDFYSSGYQTNGPSMSGGNGWGGSDHTYVAPVQFGPNMVALPAHESTAGVESWATEVVSGHPTLIAGGVARDNNGDPLCSNRHPRTALGFNADRSKMYLAVIDGRATGRIGMTCDEMVALMTELGATDAVNLDGGGSSTMWIQGAGVLNYPSDGSQRVVANHLAIHATGSGGSAHCAPRYDASYVTQVAPMEMTAGEEAVVSVDMTNLGNVTWDLVETRVGTQDPQDRDSVFFKEGNWFNAHRPTGADHSNYDPSSVGRFTWVMKAPAVFQTTTFDETFQLVQEGVTWFGPKFTMSIVVHPVDGPTTPDPDPDPAPDPDPTSDPDPDPGDDASGGCSAGHGGTGLGLAFALVALAWARRCRRRRRAPVRSAQSLAQ